MEIIYPLNYFRVLDDGEIEDLEEGEIGEFEINDDYINLESSDVFNEFETESKSYNEYEDAYPNLERDNFLARDGFYREVAEEELDAERPANNNNPMSSQPMNNQPMGNQPMSNQSNQGKNNPWPLNMGPLNKLPMPNFGMPFPGPIKPNIPPFNKIPPMNEIPLVNLVPPFNQPGYPKNLGLPPSTIPSKFNKNVKNISNLNFKGGQDWSNTVRFCLHRFTYIWQRNGRSYWAFLISANRNFITGWRWNNWRWVFFGIDMRRIEAFYC